MKRLLPWLLSVPLCSFGQKIENVKAEVQGPNIIISYDILEGSPGDTYTISITSSASSFKTTLRKVTGDIGKGIPDGPGKKITWQAQAELINFKGPISFDIQGEIVAALSFTSNAKSVKRGSNQRIAWRGGDRSQDVKIELLKAGAVTDVLTSVSNNGSYSWSVPSGQKPGGDYQIRLTNGRETVSQLISIKRKIPTLVKVIPVVAIVGVAAVLAGGKKGGGSSTQEPATNLASPPDILGN